MNYLAIKETDLNNGDGINVSFWVSGCPHHCQGCHNPETWDNDHGEPFTLQTIDIILKAMDKPWKPDLSILGGEPLADYNYEGILKLCQKVKHYLPDRKIWLWTGYTEIELVKQEKLDILENIDYIITGRFIQDRYEPNLKYRGSNNQLVYKVERGRLTYLI